MQALRAISIALVLVVAIIVPRLSSSEGTEADQPCTPIHKECPCGQEPDKENPGQCKQGKNMYQCACKDTTNGQVAASGRCIAENKCLADTCDGKPCEQAKPKAIDPSLLFDSKPMTDWTPLGSKPPTGDAELFPGVYKEPMPIDNLMFNDKSFMTLGDTPKNPSLDYTLRSDPGSFNSGGGAGLTNSFSNPMYYPQVDYSQILGLGGDVSSLTDSFASGRWAGSLTFGPGTDYGGLRFDTQWNDIMNQLGLQPAQPTPFSYNTNYGSTFPPASSYGGSSSNGGGFWSWLGSWLK